MHADNTTNEQHQITLEILHEGEHWIPCHYMARVAEEAIKEFEYTVQYNKVVTKTLEGAKRYAQIIKQEKRLVPIPSIIINNQIAFDKIPGKEELVEKLNHIIHKRK